MVKILIGVLVICGGGILLFTWPEAPTVGEAMTPPFYGSVSLRSRQNLAQLMSIKSSLEKWKQDYAGKTTLTPDECETRYYNEEVIPAYSAGVTPKSKEDWKNEHSIVVVADREIEVHLVQILARTWLEQNPTRGLDPKRWAEQIGYTGNDRLARERLIQQETASLFSGWILSNRAKDSEDGSVQR